MPQLVDVPEHIPKLEICLDRHQKDTQPHVEGKRSEVYTLEKDLGVVLGEVKRLA